jgi:hypothetical protein
MKDAFPYRSLRGQVRAFYSPDCKPGMRCPLRARPTEWHHNEILISWCGLVIPLLEGNEPMNYRIGALYIEYENNGGAVVTPPAFARSDDVAAYYESLGEHADRDYLRVPIIARTTTQADGFPFPNILTVTARTSGSVGQHGKPFSAAVQSRVYGGAAIAMPDESDATQDRVLSRFYFDEATSQLVKILGSEIGYDWRFTTE